MTRHRNRRPPAAPAPLPLFAWASAEAARRARLRAPIRLLMLDAYRDAEGEPRPALLIPGRRLPTIFPNLATALRVKADMEAAQ
ncbi:hypothetical protein E0493_02055 [Roseomonas sp. M0104]|uniref:Uncharacterized protein n=1 Tax=Teichococcus coralli TaxID=2545983 RepID=A0A845B652_9PROT|nr:hypothetical protein [Pseudoroseomonas coralli]MXP62135.1 hypothetical protein [Pseudoroseomonas coralli]